jgi:uncharacterized membrane protein
MEDTTTQNVLSTFLGSFIFSLVGIIVLSTGAYGARGRVVLFGATLLVLVLIVVSLLRWIDHLSQLGRVTETTALVEERASKAMRERRDNPYLGGSPLFDATTIPEAAAELCSGTIGYVQHVDVRKLSAVVGDGPGRIYVRAIPGDFVDTTHPIALLAGASMDDFEQRIRDAFTISDTRSFDQDPRYGATVLAEIGSRALSSGVNDPGTAIDVIGRAVRLMSLWANSSDPVEPEYPRVLVPPVELEEMFDDLFTPLARDGASVVEVGIRLQRAFLALARLDPVKLGPVAARHAREAIERSAGHLMPLDHARVVAVAREVSQ